MNLMKLFNINYLMQNLKKSRVVLSIFIGLIPILNTIILIMMLSANGKYVLNFASISIINFVGIYILPIIISICLFNYIYKKKSVDFINSMPISRKSIFVTNTILGILIFSIMLFVNTILIWSTCKIFGSPIPFMMLFDYFWFFLLVYIFVFSATNLAMSISGNAITQIVVTLLLLFLMPFTHFYTSYLYNETGFNRTLIKCNDEECLPSKYVCQENDVDCLNNLKENKYFVDIYDKSENNYTTPFDLFNISSFGFRGEIINVVSIIKMLLLSIVYIVIGYILFIRRRMEVTETSFKNIHIHNLVRSLTLVPIAGIAYFILRYQGLITILFIVILMFIYYLVYDLITKRSIQNIGLSCLYFVVSLAILTTVFSIVDQDNYDETVTTYNDIVIKYEDIDEVSVYFSDYMGREYDYRVYLSNRELIDLLVKTSLNQYDYDYTTEDIVIYFKMNNNREYKAYKSIDENTYNKIISLLAKEQKYLDYYKDINMDDVYALKLGNRIYTNEEAKPYLKLIKDTLDNLSLEKLVELQYKYRNVNSDYYFKLYTYSNHDREEFVVNSYISYDLLNVVVNLNNSFIKDKLTPVIPMGYYLYYENAYLENGYKIDFDVIRSAKNEIYEFMLKNIGDEVDMTKDYFTFSIHMDYSNYYFTTNKVDEIKAILNKKYEEIKNTKDYQNKYNNSTVIESVEYYD